MRVTTDRDRGMSSKLLWFAGLWLAGVATVAVVGGVIKLWLGV